MKLTYMRPSARMKVGTARPTKPKNGEHSRRSNSAGRPNRSRWGWRGPDEDGLRVEASSVPSPCGAEQPAHRLTPIERTSRNRPEDAMPTEIHFQYWT